MTRSRRAALVVPLLALALAGCTSDFLISDAPTPSATADPTPTAEPSDPTPTASATPTATPDPEPTFEADGCAEVVLDRPGAYAIGDCTRLTINGPAIRVTAASIGVLVINGDRAEVSATLVARAEVSGQQNEIETGELGVLVLRGDGNAVSTQGRVVRVDVQGNDNFITSPLGFDVVDDAGADNYIGVPPAA